MAGAGGCPGVHPWLFHEQTRQCIYSEGGRHKQTRKRLLSAGGRGKQTGQRRNQTGRRICSAGGCAIDPRGKQTRQRIYSAKDRAIVPSEPRY